jgi:dipeptide/tripeptide permease
VLNGTTSVLYGTIGDLVAAERQSRGFSLFYTLSSVCGFAAPLAYGVLGDWLGIQFALALAGCLVLLTLPLTALLRPVITRAAAPAAAET